ncbi:MAG: tyrosine-type recombinase/integrase [Phycisphaerae bacterium]
MLTELAIRRLAPKGNARIELWDDKVSGFGVRVSPRGTKSFVLMYYAAGRKRRLTLGRFPTMSLASARKEAYLALSTIAEGSAPELPDKVATRTANLKTVIDEFVANHCARHNRPSHARETERLLRVRFATAWGERDVRSIGRGDVLQVLDAIVASGYPSAANHALVAIRKFFNWALERGLVDANPCTCVSRPAPVNSRERVLSSTELGAVWHGTQSLSAPFSQIVQLLVLTAQRRGEVAGMCWSEIDWNNAIWKIPAGRTKSRRAHAVPLSQLALEILKSAPKIHDEFVFPARGNDEATPSGFSKTKRRLDAYAGVTDWTLHDLRRTTATHLAGSGVAPHVIERILNHTTGTLGGVAGIYNRFQYQPEMRRALELWAEQIGKLASEFRQAST